MLSLESDPLKIEAWHRNITDAGLAEWAELVEGDAHTTLPAIDDVFDVVFLTALLRVTVPLARGLELSAVLA